MKDYIQRLVLEYLEKLISEELLGRFEKEAKKYVIQVLRQVAKESPGDLDDKVVEIVAKALGV